MDFTKIPLLNPSKGTSSEPYYPIDTLRLVACTNLFGLENFVFGNQGITPCCCLFQELVNSESYSLAHWWYINVPRKSYRVDSKFYVVFFCNAYRKITSFIGRTSRDIKTSSPHELAFGFELNFRNKVHSLIKCLGKIIDICPKTKLPLFLEICDKCLRRT